MLRTKYVEGMKRFDPNDAQIAQLMEELEVERLKKHVPRVLRTALIVAAICVAMAASALALSPTLREALESALGAYAPYATAVEGAVCVENGIEIKVVSAMADSSVVRIYVEARDLEGDRLSADMGVSASIKREKPTDENWIYSYSTGASCVDYDAETKTALLEINTSGTITGDLEGAELVLLGLYPNKSDWSNGLGEKNWTVPLSIKKMEERTVALTGTVWAAKLREAMISPLGITIRTGAKEGDGNLNIKQFAVQLDSGDFYRPSFSGMGGDSYASPDPVSATCWKFDDPEMAKHVTGLAFGYWFIPIDGNTAGEGYWLSELPE